jgi:hypothetical protein
MAALGKERGVACILFDDYVQREKSNPELGTLSLVRLREANGMLDVCYELFRRVFNPAVLDSKSTYLDLLSPDGLRLDGFAPICVAAYFQLGGVKVVVGFLASNVMWIDQEQKLLQLAIGNVASSPALRQTGFKGVGTSVLNFAVECGQGEAAMKTGELAYMVAEAESESLGFWRNLGFLWPDGVRYMQPPLEFDDRGVANLKEVPETLLVRPLNSRKSDLIECDIVRKIVLSIYRNWCIETNRRKLSPPALAAAESYVLEHVFSQTNATIPKAGFVRLRPPAEAA